MTESNTETIHTCRSCQAAFAGKFCNQCGEKILDPSEKSIRSFLGSLFHEITTLDGKFIRTLVLMMRKPGEVSYNYMNGKRVPYYKPVSMFFLANLLYFVFPLFNALSTRLSVQMKGLPYSPMAAKKVNAYLQANNLDLATFEIMFNQQCTNMAKMVLVVMVLYFSLPLAAVNWNRRMYYSDHLLVSLEACSLIILLNFVGLIGLLNILAFAGQAMGFDWGFLLHDRNASLLSIILLLYLFYKLERRVYDQGPMRAFAKSAVLVFGYFLVLQLYRASLFFITMWTV